MFMNYFQQTNYGLLLRSSSNSDMCVYLTKKNYMQENVVTKVLNLPYLTGGLDVDMKINIENTGPVICGFSRLTQH